MNPEKISPEQSEEFGKPVPNSKYFRDFCASCGEPIRVSSEKLYDDNFCRDCDCHPLKDGSVTKLGHLSDYYGAASAEGGNDYESENIEDADDSISR